MLVDREGVGGKLLKQVWRQGGVDPAVLRERGKVEGVGKIFRIKSVGDKHAWIPCDGDGQELEAHAGCPDREIVTVAICMHCAATDKL